MLIQKKTFVQQKTTVFEIFLLPDFGIKKYAPSG